ncbi:3-phosphoshikimate 1-carboxyvinyltransferase [candidate division KSB1 bacterium]
MNRLIKKSDGICGEIAVPGDKSISIRSVIFGSIAEGDSFIKGLGTGGDIQSAVKCLKQLGVSFEEKEGLVKISGKGLYGLSKPASIIDVGNSGTTLRLMSGVLAGQKFESVITGDDSIQSRPMKRITAPLKMMGAEIKGRDNDNYAPLSIIGKKLNSIKYVSPIASAQVKSSIMLAGLYAEGVTRISEPYKSRDHTERMMEYMGVRLNIDENRVSIEGGQSLKGREIFIPGDVSSAAFLIAAALVVNKSEILLKDVGINPARTGILDVLKRMGGNIDIQNIREKNSEPVADIVVKSSELKGVEISGEIIPRIIDEIPILAVVSALSDGETVIKDAAELRVKETDRIKSVVVNLKKMGAYAEEREDGMIIRGENKLKGAELESFGDHRIAISFAVAGLAAEGDTIIKDSEWAEISFPGFFDLLF